MEIEGENVIFRPLGGVQTKAVVLKFDNSPAAGAEFSNIKIRACLKQGNSELYNQMNYLNGLPLYI